MDLIGNTYQLQEKIGQGTHAEVYRAQDLNQNIRVIIKCYMSASDPGFSHEVRILDLLDNYSGYIQCLQSFVESDRGYLVFDDLNTRSLQNYLQSGARFSIEKIQDAAQQLSEQIGFIYERGILHQDIMASNIVLNDSQFYLIDFGNAEQQEKIKVCHTSFNSLYMAPEVYSGYRGIEAEVYSLGCVLYYMATQGSINHMFGLSRYSSKAEKIYAHCYRSPEFPSYFPDSLTQLLIRMLHKDPDKRPSVYQLSDLIAELKEPSDQPLGYPEPFDIYRTLAGDHKPYGFYQLGKSYLHGLGTSIDEKQGSDCLRQAEQMGFIGKKMNADKSSTLEEWLECHRFNDDLYPVVNLNTPDKTGMPETHFSEPIEAAYQRACQQKDIPLQIRYLEQLAPLTEQASYYNILGVLYKKTGEREKAVKAFNAGLEIEPDKKTILSNLASFYNEGYQFIDAERVLRQLTRTHSDSATGFFKMGTLYKEWHKFDLAEKAYKEALKRRPGDGRIQNQLGQLLLLTGRFDEGFEYREARLKLEKNARPHDCLTSDTLYRGEPLSGKTILVYREQGLGDTLHYLRYLPWLKRQGARIIFRVNPPLKALIEQSGYADQILLDNASIAQVEFDYHVSLLSLPVFFPGGRDNIPREFPYLKAPEHSTVTLERSDHDVNIGIVWEGGAKSANNEKRNVDIRYFAELAGLPGVRLFSLQLSRQNNILYQQGLDDCITDLSDQLTSMEDTASVIRQLDLVISVDTAVAHLAGAMNHPVWMPLQYTPDYRWGMEGDFSCWYPSIRLFRETERKEDGNWDEAFKRIKAVLGQWLKS